MNHKNMKKCHKNTYIMIYYFNTQNQVSCIPYFCMIRLRKKSRVMLSRGDVMQSYRDI